ncbi:MAG: ATP-binding protein, partial [Acidimicrobiales bacterium]
MNRRVASPRLVGRLDEVTALGDALTRAIKGDGSTVIVTGEAGIGKTRLVSAVADDAAGRGFLVLSGGCVELGEDGVPLAPVAEALRRLRDQVGVAGLVEMLGTAVPELGALVPGLVTDDTAVDSQPVPPGRLLELLLGLLEHLASSAPVLFVIEDLHWADRSTLDLLVFLERNLSGPVVLLATLRSDELHRRHPLRPVLAELIRSGAPTRVDLLPFTRRELADQVEAITGAAPHDDVLEALYRRCEGNPLFAEELLAATTERPDQLPSTLRDILMGRISHLPDVDQQTLRLAAAVGIRVDDGLLHRIGSGPEGELDESLRRLVDDNLLEPAADGEGYCFRHALLQEIVYDELLPGERRRIHAEIARELTNQAAGGAIAAAAVAHHWYRARNLPAALVASVEAGLAAERVPAPAESVRHFERALELWDAVPDADDLASLDHVQLLAHAAEQENLIGNFARSIAHIRLALDQIDPAVDPITAGLLHERLGRFLWTADQDGLPDHVRALELVPAEPPSAERARVLAGYAQILMLNGSLAQSAEVAADAVEIARTVGAIQAEGHALNTLGTVLIPQGRVDEGMECLERSRQIAHDIGNLDDMARACVNLTHSLSVLGRWDELIVEGEAGVEWARRVGQDRTCGVYVESNLLDALVARGRWDEAAERSASLPTRLPIGYWEYFTGGSVLADRGDFVRAREIAERLVDVPDDGTAMLQGLTDHVVGAMALAIWTGEPEQARSLMDLGLVHIPDPFLFWRGGELFWR